MLTALEASALSCPGEQRAGIVAKLRANLQREYVWGLLVRSGEALAREAPALAALLQRSRDDASLFVDAIPCQQAALVASTCGREDDAGWVAAQVGLALRHAGVLDPWSVRFRTPRRVRFAAWVSPPLGELDTAELEDVEARGWVRLPALAVQEGSFAVLPNELDEVCPIEAPRFRWKPSDAIPDCVAALSTSLDVLARDAPEYLGWIEHGIHTIVPVDSPPDANVSKSIQNVDGVVVIGLPADSATLGELLVHEASHQLLHLVEPVVAISNGYDTHQYFSPFARADRDVRRMLLGFHAFANIAAYYLRIGGNDADKWLAQWFPALERSHRAIAMSKGLTPHGRALFEPVASLIGL